MGPEVGLAVRLRMFFGQKPGQSLKEFMEEVKTLNEDDKLWFLNEFNRMGLPTVIHK